MRHHGAAWQRWRPGRYQAGRATRQVVLLGRLCNHNPFIIIIIIYRIPYTGMYIYHHHQ